MNFPGCIAFYNELQLNGENGFKSAGIGGSYLVDDLGNCYIEITSLAVRGKKMKKKKIKERIQHLEKKLRNKPSCIILDQDGNNKFDSGDIKVTKTYDILHALTRIIYAVNTGSANLYSFNVNRANVAQKKFKVDITKVRELLQAEKKHLRGLLFGNSYKSIQKQLRILSTNPAIEDFWRSLSLRRNETFICREYKVFLMTCCKLYVAVCSKKIGQVRSQLQAFLDISEEKQQYDKRPRFKLCSQGWFTTLPCWDNAIETVKKMMTNDDRVPAWNFSLVAAEWIKWASQCFNMDNKTVDLLHLRKGKRPSHKQLKEAIMFTKGRKLLRLDNEFTRNKNVIAIVI